MQLCSGLRELELPRPIVEAVASCRLFSSWRLSSWSGGAASL